MKMPDEIEKVVVLFDSNDYTSQQRSIILSDSVANYSFIEILYKDGDNSFNSVKIKTIDKDSEKTVSLSTNTVFDDVIYIKSATATVSNNSIIINYENAYYINSEMVNFQGKSESMFITTVLAYR